MAFEFANILGLWGLLALIPLVLMYLVKPRPNNLKVPSLMFFFSKERTTTAESFFRHFHQDFLFLIQLAILVLLAFAVSQPLVTINRDAVSNNIVFVLDV